MAKAISVKLEEGVYETAQRLVHQLGTSRNAYINQAIAHYNGWQERRALARRLRQESRLLQGESKAVLEEFERLPEELP